VRSALIPLQQLLLWMTLG